MSKQRILELSVVCLVLLVSGCGGSSNGGGLPGSANALAAVTTQTCGNIRGASALYWDFSTGFLRGDYPLDATLPPSPSGGSFLHPRISLTFFYPAGWNPVALVDNITPANVPATVIQGNLTVFAGVSLLRQDNRALWRYLLTSENSGDSAQQRLNAEIQRLLNGFGITDAPQELCSLQGPGVLGGFTGNLSAIYLRAGEFTIQVVTTATTIPQVNQGQFYATTTSLAPTTEFDAHALDTWLPIGFQLLAGGGTPTQCSDDIDNDGDGQVDLNDAGCSSPGDDSEAG